MSDVNQTATLLPNEPIQLWALVLFHLCIASWHSLTFQPDYTYWDLWIKMASYIVQHLLYNVMFCKLKNRGVDKITEMSESAVNNSLQSAKCHVQVVWLTVSESGGKKVKIMLNLKNW